MDIDLFVTPAGVEERGLRDKTVVMVDVLRCSTSICAALTHQCREVIPVATVEEAMRLSSNLFQETTMLCGERQGTRIEGFELGNSPLEYTAARVAGKTVVLTTTNGTVALTRSRSARQLLVGAFVNMDRLLDHLAGQGGDVVIVCAGKEQRFSLEDTACGGMIIDRLRDRIKPRPTLSDSARSARVLFRHFAKDLGRLLRTSAHGRVLETLAFQNDLDVCAQLNAYPVIPEYQQGRITALG